MRTKKEVINNAIVYFKKIDSHNKIVIPKPFIDKYGGEFYLKMYADKIILEPIKK